MLALVLLVSIVAGGCIWEDRCVPPAQRVGDRCVLGAEDGGGSDAGPTDGGPDAGDAIDAGRDGGGSDAGSSDAGCVAVSETCNGDDDDCDGWIDEGLQRAVGAPMRLVEGTVAEAAPDVAATSDDYVVVFTSAADDRIRYARVGADGSITSGPTLVESSASAQSNPSLVLSPDGNVVAAWTEAPGTLRARVIGASGPTGSTVTVDPAAVGPAAMTSMGGRVYVAWPEGDGVFGRSYDSALADPTGEVRLTLSQKMSPVLLPVAGSTPSLVLGYIEATGASTSAVYVDRILVDPLAAENNPQPVTDESGRVEGVAGVGIDRKVGLAIAAAAAEVVFVDVGSAGTPLTGVERVSLTGGGVEGPESSAIAHSMAGFDAVIGGEFTGYRVDHWPVSSDGDLGPVSTFGGAQFVPATSAARLSHLDGAVVFNAYPLGSVEIDLWFQRLGCPE